MISDQSTLADIESSAHTALAAAADVASLEDWRISYRAGKATSPLYCEVLGR